MIILGKKLETVGSVALAIWYVAQTIGLFEDKVRARKDDVKDRRIQELEAEVKLLKLQKNRK